LIPFSILDLCPVPENSTPADAFHNSLDLAQHAERWGYCRYWLAEHHNLPGVASAATSVVIGHIAGGTKTIRVGSGGVMLPNHAPLVIAEQFGTLASLYPDRIDLGLGRAPGTDPLTAAALRRNNLSSADHFPNDVQELQRYFKPLSPGQRIQAVPAAGLHVPIWLLGSSLYSAQLASNLGLPFAFASHFAPAELMQALSIYRSEFQPSGQLDRPYAMCGINVIAADTDAEARRNFTSLQQSFINLRRGKPGRIPPPIDDIDTFCPPAERVGVDYALSCSIIGSPATIELGLVAFIEKVKPDELMITANLYSHAARLRSFEIVAEVRNKLQADGND
jgi:luciferase family oxidoreductase group 1